MNIYSAFAQLSWDSNGHQSPPVRVNASWSTDNTAMELQCCQCLTHGLAKCLVLSDTGSLHRWKMSRYQAEGQKLEQAAMPHPWICSMPYWMGLGQPDLVLNLTVGNPACSRRDELDDPWGPFQLKLFCYSMILWQGGHHSDHSDEEHEMTVSSAGAAKGLEQLAKWDGSGAGGCGGAVRNTQQQLGGSCMPRPNGRTHWNEPLQRVGNCQLL